MDLLYGIKILAEVSVVLSRFMRLTDGQTDISAMANTTRHSMQHDTNDRDKALLMSRLFYEDNVTIPVVAVCQAGPTLR